MGSFYIYLAAVGGAAVLSGGVCRLSRLYKIVVTDAECRGLKSPKFWGFMSISGNNNAGLILYLLARKNHPVIRQSPQQKGFIARQKKIFATGLVFLITGAIICVWRLVLM